MKKLTAIFKKISWKLTLSYVAMFSIVLVLLSIGILYGIKYYLTQQALAQVGNSADITKTNIMDMLDENGNLADPELLSEASADSRVSIIIADENGRIISSSVNPESLYIDTTGLDSRAKIIKSDETKFASLGKLLEYSDRKVYLLVEKNLQSEYSFIDVTATTIVIADIIGILLALTAGIFISKRMLRPIDEITTTADKISISDLNRRIELRGNDDELDRLAGTFNKMIERLRLSFEKQNSFVSDASHELRTPIAVIKGYIEMMDRWGKEEKVVLDEAIDAIKNETKDMGNLVERLLFLARSDTGKLLLNKERFSLYGLVEDIILEYKLIIPEQEFITDIPELAEIDADRSLLKQALRAIIDNSIKYDPNNNEIIILAVVLPGEIQLAVKDSGIGISQEKIKGIFERFCRADSVRERKTGGTGLGLAIAKMITDMHGGSISAESEPDIGTTITMFLPLSS